MESLIKKKTWQDIISKLAPYFVPKQIIFMKKNPHGTAAGIIVVHLLLHFGRYVCTWIDVASARMTKSRRW